jgi:hypothetical protein
MANSIDNWITITSGATGTAHGMIEYSASANNGGANRMGMISVADQSFTLTQTAAGGCIYSLSPTGAAYAPSGGSGSFSIAAPDGCTWTPNTKATWITITSGGSSGSGAGQIGYTVAANPGPPAREGLVTIADQTFTVDQAAPGDQADLSIDVVFQTAEKTMLAPTATGLDEHAITEGTAPSVAGPNSATGVTVSAATPAGTTFASSTGPGSSAAPAVGYTGPTTFSIGSIPANTSVSFTLVVNVLGALNDTDPGRGNSRAIVGPGPVHRR